MKKLKIILPALFLTAVLMAQQTNQVSLPFKMEDLSSPRFAKAVDLAGGVCVIPIGIIEKHGPHLPLGTDLYEAREIAFYAAEIKSLKKAKLDGHAGEEETSMMYYINPVFIDQEAMKNESGLDQDRLSKLPFGYAGIWWYAKYPNHFASDINTPNMTSG
jgi:creatinine amidohydrolase/Fe(II)-dependent formamide hydrolase-like protein